MKKQKGLKYDSITFDEFIDIITDNRGEEIKRKMKEIALNTSHRKNLKKP
ncbi:MAG TPA: hypothetical protein VJI15_05745 [Candidatus Nanoarchaeia archaeon]|nr:hypothetical protein [Candidatus Nanoarchaeia archaeon]